MQSDNLEARLISWAAEFLSVPVHKITLSSRLNMDLGIAGEDGSDFIRAFGKEFNVDVSAFPISIYFGPEASDPFEVFRFIFRLFSRSKPTKLQPLSLNDLLVIAKEAKHSNIESTRVL